MLLRRPPWRAVTVTPKEFSHLHVEFALSRYPTPFLYRTVPITLGVPSSYGFQYS